MTPTQGKTPNKTRSKRAAKPRPQTATTTRSTTHPAEQAQPVQEDASAFIVVGIGASAGGLAALEEFFRALPAHTHAAFVVVMHLDAVHTSVLAELLQRCTPMPVQTIIDKHVVEPDQIYVNPPGQQVTIKNGRLRLTALSKNRSRSLTIDAFFESLAQDQQHNAIGIVLSGTGSDGSLGIQAIKKTDGTVMAQDDSATYTGMPHSAIETGLVDFVLPASEMPACLQDERQYADLAPLNSTPAIDSDQLETVHKILALLRSRTGHDFSRYKSNTILRRLHRRLLHHKLNSVAAYLDYLRAAPDEARLLQQEFLIGITSFFRDPQAFDSLKNNVENILVRGRDSEQSIRVWVPACSTGEEAYSVAILLQESIEACDAHLAYQIFATDIDEHAIAHARAGRFDERICADLSTERLHRFFDVDDSGSYRVKKHIREKVVFSLQNVTSDPSFSRLDLICCRNLLIYFSPELQRQVLSLFHYSLRPDGLLLLGLSESIGAIADSFDIVDRANRLFTRIPNSRPPATEFRIFQHSGAYMHKSGEPELTSAKPKPDLSLLPLIQAVLRESDTPPCAVVDAAFNIVFVHGHTGHFLEPAEGAVNVNIVDMAQPGLKEPLTTCLRQVKRESAEVRQQSIVVHNHGHKVHVDLLVKPLSKHKALTDYILVIFKECGEPEPGRTTMSDKKSTALPPGSLDELQQQLARSHEDLQITIEEFETANEELQSTNEELQSTNEELQSANEELGTSKEELQSLNEESITVNAELQSRISELSRANDDLKNLLDSTGIATIFLDTQLNIRRFTPACTHIIPLAATDIGRSLTHFATELVDVDLGKVASAMLDDLVVREIEVETKHAQTYLLRVRPYRTSNNVIDGTVLTFEDRTLIVQARRIMQQQLAQPPAAAGAARQKPKKVATPAKPATSSAQKKSTTRKAKAHSKRP